jgi:hypothetical protein
MYHDESTVSRSSSLGTSSFSATRSTSSTVGNDDNCSRVIPFLLDCGIRATKLFTAPELRLDYTAYSSVQISLPIDSAFCIRCNFMSDILCT